MCHKTVSVLPISHLSQDYWFLICHKAVSLRVSHLSQGCLFNFVKNNICIQYCSVACLEPHSRLFRSQSECEQLRRSSSSALTAPSDNRHILLRNQSECEQLRRSSNSALSAPSENRHILFRSQSECEQLRRRYVVPAQHSQHLQTIDRYCYVFSLSVNN